VQDGAHADVAEAMAVPSGVDVVTHMVARPRTIRNHTIMAVIPVVAEAAIGRAAGLNILHRTSSPTTIPHIIRIRSHHLTSSMGKLAASMATDLLEDVVLLREAAVARMAVKQATIVIPEAMGVGAITEVAAEAVVTAAMVVVATAAEVMEVAEGMQDLLRMQARTRTANLAEVPTTTEGEDEEDASKYRRSAHTYI